MASTSPRTPRQVVRRPDGTEVVMRKPPRVDVLWYPRHHWPTVLVRRTHDLELARELAEARWAELDDDRPLVGTRIGWWRTYPSPAGPPPDAAEDATGRVVQWSPEARPPAGPGVEFRP